MKRIETCLLILAASAGSVLSAAADGATYTSVASGDWEAETTWNESGVPVSAGNETVRIASHCVTNGAENLTAYKLLIGVKTGSPVAALVKTGGVFTSQRLTEVGNEASRTSPSRLELRDTTATFKDYRLVVGRTGGNACVLATNSVIVTESHLLMGITTARDAAPNVIELHDSIWTNGNNFWMGFSSMGTNVIRLVRSTLYSSKILQIGVGTAEGNTSVFGDEFLTLEDNSSLLVPNTSVKLPVNRYHRAHVVISNSCADVSQFLLGNVAETTNDIAFIDSTFTSRGTSWMGYEPNTVNRILLKDLHAEKMSADAVLDELSFRSESGERRIFDVNVVGGDWTSASAFTASQNYNDRTFTFRDLELPVSRFYVGNSPDSPGTLVISNCVCAAATIAVALGNNGRGTLKVFDSTLTNGATFVVADEAIAKDGTTGMIGEALLSGGTYDFNEVRFRKGTGRLVLDRGARLTAGTCYLPNLTGACAYLEIGGGASFSVTNKFTIGNQAKTSCEVLIRDGGKLIVDQLDQIAFANDPTSFTFTVTGEGSEAKFIASTMFATASGTTGTLNLDGGVFQTKSFGSPKSDANQIINFNGGVLRASTAANAVTLTAATSKNYVDVGGAVIETSLPDQTVSLYGALQHKGEASVTDGGLTKQGSGDLYLYAANTFNGPVTVKGGRIISGCAAALPEGVTVTLDLANGACLGCTNKGSYPEAMTISVTNAESLDPKARYVIAENWNGASSATVNLPNGWVTRLNGSTLQAHCPKGLTILLK